MMNNSQGENAAPTQTSTIAFEQQVERMRQLAVIGRWLVAAVLWLTIGVASLWRFRRDLQLMMDYFTWAAMRYALAGAPLAAIGLGLCVGMTVSVLIWQSRNILFGLPQAERKQFERQVIKIRQQGTSHPLWRWIDR